MRARRSVARAGRSRRVDEVTRHVVPFVGEGEQILDLGCGTGKISRELRDASGVKPTLADVVAYNRTDLPYILLDDPYRVPVPDGSFDVVLLLFVLHHVGDAEGQRRVFDEGCRIARRAVLVMEDTPEGRFERAVNTVWDFVLNAYLGVATPFTFRTTAQWLREFERNGMVASHVERYRPMWPTLKTYHHTFFVLEKRAPGASGQGRAR
jgi:ubiquinone/menaquinone biosynthesis C-methylase UbiE